MTQPINHARIEDLERMRRFGEWTEQQRIVEIVKTEAFGTLLDDYLLDETKSRDEMVKDIIWLFTGKDEDK